MRRLVLLAILSLMSSGCYAHSTIAAERIDEVRALCGMPPDKQPGWFKITEKTQFKTNEKWQSLCRTQSHPSDEVKLRTPDKVTTVGAVVAGSLVTAVVGLGIYLVFFWDFSLL